MIEIKIENGVAELYSPYNPDFVAAIKKIGKAKWNASKKCWCIQESAVEPARKIMYEFYGYTDITENDTVTVRVTFKKEVCAVCGPVVLLGKVIAQAYGRDSGITIGEDVAFISGGANSGGSSKNWETNIRAGSVAILSNVNKNLYARSESSKPTGVSYEIIGSEPNRSELIAERERLLKRISEIEKILGNE